MSDSCVAVSGQAELDAERAYLAYAVECLRRSRVELLEMAERAKKTSDDELVIWLLRRARQLENDDESPLFFGRMELDEIGLVYVGRRHVSDPRRDDEIVVTDWRTTMASRFYRASQANPMGVRLRRRSAISSHSAGKRSTPPGVATRFTLVWHVRWLFPAFVNCL
jgi:hypothetical protein